MRYFILFIIILFLSAESTTAQQKRNSDAPRQEIKLGPGMGSITPGLVQIASKTNAFLQIADQIPLTEQQRTSLETIVFEFRAYAAQKTADLNVNDAQLERLLTNDNIDLDAARTKVKEIEALNADLKVKQIELLLKAINILTHQQHLRVVVLSQLDASEAVTKLQPERVH